MYKLHNDIKKEFNYGEGPGLEVKRICMYMGKYLMF